MPVRAVAGAFRFAAHKSMVRLTVNTTGGPASWLAVEREAVSLRHTPPRYRYIFNSNPGRTCSLNERVVQALGHVVPGGPWTRVDSHCYPGWMIAPYYDSLIAKLIVWAPNREAAIDRMTRALSEFQIEGRGVKTTIPFHLKVLANEQFRSGDVSTDFLEHFEYKPQAAAA